MGAALRNDMTPPLCRELSAVERTMRGIDWLTQRLHERGKLRREDREERALAYEQSAASYAKLAERFPTVLEFAGLHAIAAKIMRAGD